MKVRKKWSICPRCYTMVFAETNSLGNHRCHEKLLAKREAELDMVVEEEMEYWDLALDAFWNAKDVKFMDHLAREKKI